MEKIRNIFKQDNGWVAALLSLLLPFVLYYPFYYFVKWLSLKTNMGIMWVEVNTIQLVVIFLNLFLLRKYILGKEYEKNGRATLAVTFVLVVVHLLLTWA